MFNTKKAIIQSSSPKEDSRSLNNKIISRISYYIDKYSKFLNFDARSNKAFVRALNRYGSLVAAQTAELQRFNRGFVKCESDFELRIKKK